MDIIAYDKTTGGPRPPDRKIIDRETRQQLQALQEFRRLLLKQRRHPANSPEGHYEADLQRT
jgi:hypothetical protein